MATDTVKFHVLTNRIPSRVVTAHGVEWVVVRKMGPADNGGEYCLAVRADDTFPADVKLIELHAAKSEES
jgi:hypothetical protein